MSRELVSLGQCGPVDLPGGRLAATVPFADVGAVRFGVLSGRGLDARLFTDLSSLEPDRLVTPNASFYVRTEAPAAVDRAGTWKITLGGLVRRPVEVALPQLLTEASERGPYVMECAGNGSGGAFGLMSAARWTGVSMSDLLARVEALPAAGRVLVSGVDHSEPSGSSSPGASWIFTRDELTAWGAFLATGMNGQPLPRDHGYPVRLYVPRWYGCACIKWVNEITLVGNDEPSTPQMREFGPRTFQTGRPELAREFKPASMDLAAMPIRVEKWLTLSGPVYRVVGVMWGGDAPVDRLSIRFHPREPFVPVQVCPPVATTSMWTLWSHLWRPSAPGRYAIVVRAADSSIRTERLDLFYYTREIAIDEV
jgi:DMSO/TMAO reductase YedYZ molybdopterin-dependent catalytic subunit